MITRGLGQNSKLITRGLGSNILTEGWQKVIKFSLAIKKVIKWQLKR